MNPRQNVVCALLSVAALIAVTGLTSAQGPEKFTATASVKNAAGAAASAPVAIEITRKMTQQEADKFTSAYAAGGAALRKALVGVAPTGSIQIGTGKPTPTRLTLERPSDRGRLLTIVTDTPILLIGANAANAKPTAGFDFGIVDLTVDAQGSGSGTMSPAAKVNVKQGVFVVEEYSGEIVRLTDLKKAK